MSKGTSYWVPYFPSVQGKLPPPGETWRYWGFRQIYLSLGGGAHRSKDGSFTMGMRMAWRPDMCRCLEILWLGCPVCAKNRGTHIQGDGRKLVV